MCSCCCDNTEEKNYKKREKTGYGFRGSHSIGHMEHQRDSLVSSSLRTTVTNTFKGLLRLVGDFGKTKPFHRYLASSSFEFYAT